MPDESEKVTHIDELRRARAEKEKEAEGVEMDSYSFYTLEDWYKSKLEAKQILDQAQIILHRQRISGLKNYQIIELVNQSILTEKDERIDYYVALYEVVMEKELFKGIEI